jgi:aspartate aminotransferase
LGLTELFREDKDARKINVGVGAYRDERGLPYVLPSVREAISRIADSDYTLEYAPISGVPGFVKCALEFAYGEDSAPLLDNRIAAVQSLSGTGAIRLFSAFVARFIGEGTPIYVPNPTWGNHKAIIKDAGCSVAEYRYLGEDRVSFDRDGMLADIAAAPTGSVFLFHACAHNPTGVDPSHEDWGLISDAVKAGGHTAFFDCAYQGFASGNADTDAFAIRQFVRDGHHIWLAQSFAKNFGLYGERVGALSTVCADSEESSRVLSQLKLIIRAMYSSPPLHGARIVETVLGDSTLRSQWYGECKGMAERIAAMRGLLAAELVKRSTRDWSHVEQQIGMFCYTGLTKEQSEALVRDHHVYLTANGRVSMAGVNPSNVVHLAESIAAVTGGK